MRASSYIIYVELPDDRDHMVLVHGYTGAFDKVTRPVGAYVRSLDSKSQPKPLYGRWLQEPDAGPPGAPSDATLQTLRRRGYLTELAEDEEYALFKKVADRLHARSLAQMPAYIVMPTYDCNLRCGYCFQDHMRTDTRFNHLLAAPSEVAMDRMCLAMDQLEQLHGVAHAGRPRRIGFFGGEPLLARNKPMIEYFMAKAAAPSGAAFWAVTNATELDAFEDLLGPGKIATLQITLDGPQEEHDRKRIYPDGTGSFERIAANIGWVLNCGVAVSLRLNIDRTNLSHLPRLAETIHAAGWDRFPSFSVYTAPIRAANPNVGRDTTLNSWELDQALAALREEYPLMRVIATPDDGLKQQARRLFEKWDGAMPTLKESFCGAHSRMYVLDTFGDIYACWERTGDPSIRVGRVDESGTLQMNMAMLDFWHSRTVTSNPVCSKCRYALHCGGGCAVLALGATGKYFANYCDGFGRRFRAAVAEAYLDHEAGAPLPAMAQRVCDA